MIGGQAGANSPLWIGVGESQTSDEVVTLSLHTCEGQGYLVIVQAASETLTEFVMK